MNKQLHLNEGQLRAALDGEISPVERQHIENCTTCQAQQRMLEAQVQQTAKRLSFLSPMPEDANPVVRAALNRFQNETITRKETPMFTKFFTLPLVRFGLAFILILAIVIVIPTTRAQAEQLLNLFRVQQVTVIPVDFTGMQKLTGDSVFGKQINELLSSSVTMTQKPGDPINATDAAQASQLTGFNVRLPKGLTPSNIYIQKNAAYTFKVDRARAQALIDEAGRHDLVLPTEIDGANIAVTIPAHASVAYGNCPAPSDDKSGSGPNGNGSAGRRYPDCVMMAEIPSPTVEAPASVNVAQLAGIGLEFTGMSAEQAAAFTKTVDWTSSLVVPIPKNAATYQQVSVDGVTGTLIQRPADDAPQYTLIWIKDGIIYTIGGLGSNSQQALQMANSLP
jgi:hypothetical protein